MDECANIYVDRRQVTQSVELSLELSTLKTLSEGESYRYLDMSQGVTTLKKAGSCPPAAQMDTVRTHRSKTSPHDYDPPSHTTSEIVGYGIVHPTEEW
ncbi:unnamed protein product [Euphydryas editha]|uniref:Uncharacterized protein n=1 Tax=Euphydryas editha TaxID=104508 RepID=A0AAU9UJ62_EUPED|nr:unnamed protein product [Euphydryas editha]